MQTARSICFCVLLALIGCGQGVRVAVISTDPNLPVVSQTISGKALDGSQPIVGAHVYLLAANTTGYENSSVSLLQEASTGYSDNVGAYALTASDGSFSIKGTYTCISSSQVYIYVLGGDAGSGTNSAIGELAALGDCPSLTAPALPSSLVVNEVTTVAAVYALAGFAVDSTHISSSGTPLAVTGMSNAFLNAANLASVSTGTALTSSVSGNATVPQSEINTLANILSACIRSANNLSAPCLTLLATPIVGNAGLTDTASAAINIAHSPAANVSSLYALQTSSSPFSPALTTVPSDFSLAINFSTIDTGGSNSIAIDADGNAWMDNGFVGGVIELSSSGYLLSGAGGYIYNLYGPGNIAIDLSGNVWIGNEATVFPTSSTTYNLVELSNTGALLSGASGYEGGGLDGENGVAIDGNGSVWAANTNGNSVSKFSASGIALSSAAGFTGAGINSDQNLAIDAYGNVWVASVLGAVAKLSTTGSILSGTSGFSDGDPYGPYGIAIDAQGNVWTTIFDPSLLYNRIVKFSNSGEVLSGPNGFTGNNVGNSINIAIDGLGNAWSANGDGNQIIELSNSGTLLSGANGYVNSAVYAPWAISVDGSGDVWTSNGDIVGSCNIVEYIGIAAPVVTPLAAGVKNNMLGTRP